jgi:RimJ/RimL family protein N-acetyltransferase
MKLQLRPVTIANRGDLDEIDAGAEERYWVHANWYWHQQSIDHPDVTFRLIHLDGVATAVGIVAYGPYYEDEALTRAIHGEYEIIHLVVDKAHRHKGIGRAAALSVLRLLLALPDCRRVVAATNLANRASALFFAGLGFRPFDRRNYDGDPMCVYERGEATPADEDAA